MGCRGSGCPPGWIGGDCIPFPRLLSGVLSEKEGGGRLRGPRGLGRPWTGTVAAREAALCRGEPRAAVAAG